MISYTVNIPLPLLIGSAIFLFLAGIVLAAWCAHDSVNKSIGESVEMAIYGLACTFFSSLITAVLVDNIELPISGEEWFAGLPYFIGELVVCLLVFFAARFIAKKIFEQEMREREQKKAQEKEARSRARKHASNTSGAGGTKVRGKRAAGVSARKSSQSGGKRGNTK